jgi:hypothetical protein
MGTSHVKTSLTGLPPYVADSRGQLTVHGIWALFQAVHGFCDQHRYPLWRFPDEKHDEAAIAAWHETFLETLASWTEVRCRVEEYEASWGMNARVYLSEGEFLASKRRLNRPSRNLWTLKLNAAGPSPVHFSTMNNGDAVRLSDLLQTRHGVDGLIYRLDKKCVAPYEAIDVPPLADATARNRTVWTWSNQEIYPVALAWPDLLAFQGDASPVLVPRAWGSVEKCWGLLGPLQLRAEKSIIVTDENGLSEVVQLMDMHDALLGDVVGYWVQPCRWPYLDGGWPGAGQSGAVYEAAQSLAPDARGEVVCDLLEVFSTTRLNPKGIKILAGSLERDGCVAINDATDAKSPKRVDRMNLAGQLLQGESENEDPETARVWTARDLRWANIQADNEGYSPVQCPETESWGFIDRNGAVAIAPQFADVGHFQQGKARAWPLATPDLVGLIDTAGAWAIAPQWRRIDAQTRRCFVVQDAADQWGAVDDRGKLIVQLQPREVWLRDAWIAEALATLEQDDPLSPWKRPREERETEVLIDGIARQWHEQMGLWVKTAISTPPYTLAVLEGVFDNDARQRDLREAGVWGLRVRVLRDQTEGILQAKAGEEGRIDTCYPVGLSCFDLSMQAPVLGLAVQPGSVIGVQWKDLAVVSADSREAIRNRN